MSLSNAIQAYVNAHITQDKLQKYVSSHPGSVQSADPARIQSELRDKASELAIALNAAYIAAAGGRVKSAGPWDISDVKDNGSGRYTIFLTYKESFERNSLYERGYPEGIHNIWSLIDTGYTARNYVYADDPVDDIGDHMRSRLSRPRTDFINKTITDFENKYGGKYKVKILNPTLY